MFNLVSGPFGDRLDASILVNRTLIGLISPENITYTRTKVPLTFTLDRPFTNARYELSGSPAVSLPGNTTLSLTMIGPQHITIFANTSSMTTVHSQTVHFYMCVGDLNGDRKITIIDIATAAIAFDTVKGDTDYNPEADMDEDGDIDIIDIATIAFNFDKTCV